MREKAASITRSREGSFFDPGLTWSGGHLEHFAYRALREHHPELSIAQAYVLVVAAKRLYTARQ